MHGVLRQAGDAERNSRDKHMRGILVWLLLVVALVAIFVVSGGLKSPVAIIVFGVAVVAGAALSFFLRRRR